MQTTHNAITETKNWINSVVIGCNFCPFAAKVVHDNTVNYKVNNSTLSKECIDALLNELIFLDNNKDVETTFLIFTHAVKNFDDYLQLIKQAELLLKKKKYNGVYQIASFHPNYLFANTVETDAENYTNRSIYPMLHLLREKSIKKAVKFYNNTSVIPANNIAFAKQKGLVYMKMLRDSCVQ